MRQNTFLLLLLFTTPIFLFNQSIDSLSYAEISGKINHYKAISPYDSVSICISEFGNDNQLCINKAVEKNGSFYLKFPINRPQEILFFFGNHYISFPFAPNYKVAFTIDGRDLKNVDYQPIKIEAKGDNELTINYIIPFLHFYRNKYLDFFFKDNQQKQIQLDGKEYGDYRIQIFEEHQHFLKEFTQQNQIKDTLFIQWADNMLRYELMHDLHYFMYHKYDMVNDFPPNFYRQLIIKHQSLNRKGAIFSRFYSLGLHYEMLYLNGEFQKNPKRKQLMREGKPIWEGKLNHLLQNADGFARDVMLSEFFNNNLGNSQVRALARKYINLIQDDIMQQALQDKLKKYIDNPNAF